MTMRFLSTRGDSDAVTASAAIAAGLAPDGGLYVPSRWPRHELSAFDGLDTLDEIGPVFLAPFFAGDPLADDLTAVCREAFSFPIPLREASGRDRLHVLEVIHGPTAAFKDVGARFLAACLERQQHGHRRPLSILVATSGDTGGAVAAAFAGRTGTQVFVLYPAGMVSPRQEKQLTCWTGNVQAFRVAGTFDDCQRLVKNAFADADLAGRLRLSSANSINIGRLLPQMVYYAAASLWHSRAHGRAPSFVVPTGNLGNALACVYARHVGMPIDRIVLATNANRTIPDYLASGNWQPRASVATLASAMDVGDPSNMERLKTLCGDVDGIRDEVSATAINDDRISARIRADFHEHGETWCPHTATAIEAYVDMPDSVRGDGDWIAVATAHPAKFETIVEPLIGITVPVPPALAKLLDLPTSVIDIPPDLTAFSRHLR